jgi:hypothetical protein
MAAISRLVTANRMRRQPSPSATIPFATIAARDRD